MESSFATSVLRTIQQRQLDAADVFSKLLRSPEPITALAPPINDLAKLIDDLLDVTRVARGKITIRHDRIEAFDVVRRAVEDQRTILADQGLSETARCG